jgi:hypothetical protein
MQNSKEHIWNVQSMPVVVPVSKASLTGALLHWQSASTGIDKSACFLHLNLSHVITSLSMATYSFWTGLVPTEDLVLKYWLSFFEYCLLVLAKNVNCLYTLSGSVSSQQIKAQIRIWVSRRSYLATLAIDQLDAQTFLTHLLQSSTCSEQCLVHPQEVKLYKYSIWYRRFQ